MTVDFPPKLLNKLSVLYPELVETVKRYSRLTLEDYSSLLWKSSSGCPIETELLQSIQNHYVDIDSPETGTRLCRQLEKQPVLQTTHHLTPTLGPVFNTADTISLCGLSKDFLYPVGVCTGVAYSNAAHSGSISFSGDNWQKILQPSGRMLNKALKSQRERVSHGETENRISLIPSKLRDALVYQSPITQNTSDIYQELQPDIQPYFINPACETSYSKWGLKTLTRIQSQIHETSRYTAFDLNHVMAEYLKLVLAKNDPHHPVYKILFDKEIQHKLLETMGNVELFLNEKPGKKTARVASIKVADLMQINDEDFYEKLQSKKFSPAVFIVFLVLNYLNGIKCLGSFYQTDYIKKFEIGWEKLFPKPQLPAIEKTPTLTTGKMIRKDGSFLYSMDLLCHNQVIDYEHFRSVKMGEIWEPVLTKLGAD